MERVTKEAVKPGFLHAEERTHGVIVDEKGTMTIRARQQEFFTKQSMEIGVLTVRPSSWWKQATATLSPLGVATVLRYTHFRSSS